MFLSTITFRAIPFSHRISLSSSPSFLEFVDVAAVNVLSHNEQYFLSPIWHLAPLLESLCITLNWLHGGLVVQTIIYLN